MIDIKIQISIPERSSGWAINYITTHHHIHHQPPWISRWTRWPADLPVMISGEQVGGCCQVSVHTNSSCCSMALEASHTQWKVPMLYKAVISSHYISPPPPINRMFVFCIFLTVHLQEFFLFVGLHYALMLAWVLLMRTNFCGSIDGVRRFNLTWSQCLQSSNIPWMTLHCRACSAPLQLALLLVVKYM